MTVHAGTIPLHEALAHELVQLGVTRAFGLMGEDTAQLINSLTDRAGIEYFGTRHESAAVMMADGHAWATRDLGVCIISRGPGFTNALTAAITSAKAGRQVLVISGTDATPRPGPTLIGPDQKALDHLAIAAATGLSTHVVTTPDSAVPALRTAVETARTGKVAVLLVPFEQFGAPVAVAPVTELATTPKPPVIQEPAAGWAADVAEALQRSRRPLVIAGAGANDPATRALLVELGDRTDALLASTLGAKDVFRGLPRNAGVVGGFSHRLALELFEEVDIVVAFGASLNKFTTKFGGLFGDATVVQVDHEPSHLGRWFRADVAVCADTGAAVRALLSALPPDAATAGWSDTDALARLVARRPEDDFEDVSTAELVDPRTLMLALDDVLSEDRVVVTDGGHFVGFPGSYLPVPAGDRFALSLDYASIGLGLGMAMGVALARPEQTTVAAVGDGGLLMSLGELETVSRYDVPMVIVVLDDHAYGAEKHFLDLEGATDKHAVFPDVNLAAVASSLGIPAHVVRTADEVVALTEQLRDVTGPVLLDCKITPWVRAEWLEEFAQAIPEPQTA